MIQIDSFFIHYPLHTFKKEEIVIRADDQPSGVYFVKSGFVKMNAVLENGRDITFNIFKPGTFFPMMWAINDFPNTYYFQSITKSELFKSPKDKFVLFVQNNPEVLTDFTKRILSGMQGLLTNIQYQLTGDSYHRVMAALLLSAKRFGEMNKDKSVKITVPLTHQEIANIAGLTRETVSLMMEKLKKENLITSARHLVIILKPGILEKELLIDETSAIATAV
jgi:CRP/FNR family transcriptional regulator, cyclic AMP receptor protein